MAFFLRLLDLKLVLLFYRVQSDSEHWFMILCDDVKAISIRSVLYCSETCLDGEQISLSKYLLSSKDIPKSVCVDTKQTAFYICYYYAKIVSEWVR